MPVVRIWRRGEPIAPVDNPLWELEVRPKRSRRNAVIVAIGLVVVFAVFGIILRHGETGVEFRRLDQFAMAAIGVFLAGGVLMLTRPRLRVGAEGIMVRNILGDNTFTWSDIRGVTFGDRRSWARLELVNDDYVPLLAIRSNDGGYAADALDRLRELGAKYTTDS